VGGGGDRGGVELLLYLCLAPAQYLGAQSTPCPGCFTPEKELRYPFYMRLCGPRGWSNGYEKLAPTGVRKQTVRSVTIRDPGRLKNVWLQEGIRNLHFIQSSPHCYCILPPESRMFLFLQGWNQVACPFETPESDRACFTPKCI